MDAGAGCGSLVADAAGPERFTFEELLQVLATAVGARVRLEHTPPSLGFALTRPVGLLLREAVLTRAEVDGLMAGLLISDTVPKGTTTLKGWLDDYRDALGRRYVSIPRRKFRGWSAPT